jgi:hypothetical protein
MTLPSARLNIPDAWGASAHCPICGACPLNILHPPQSPDEFACPRCGAEFELEQNGSRIWLNALPQDLHKALGSQWVTIDEVKSEVEKLKQQFEQPAKAPVSEPALTVANLPPPVSTGNKPAAKPAASAAKVPPPAPPPAPDPELVAQARELYSLGNTVDQIRVIMGRTNRVSSKELDAILEEVTRLDRKKHNRQNRNVIIAVIISLLILSCCLAVAFSFKSFQSNLHLGNQPAGQSAAPTQGSILNPADLPDPLKTLVPAGMTVVSVPTPLVIQGSVNDSAHYQCPENAIQAARLFGGSTENWSFKQGWMLISKTPVTLHVPANMSAGYIVFSPDMEMKSVNGPVTIQNIYMVIISCA